MTNYDVVKKLIGPVGAVGETRSDEKRYNNLIATIDLVSSLLFDIKCAAEDFDRCEYSMKKIGKRAKGFLQEIKNEY